MERIGSIAERSAQLAIELRVTNLDRSIGFYINAGFSLDRKTSTFASLVLAGRYLFLSEWKDAEAGPTPPNIRIIVEDVDAALLRAQAHHWPLKFALKDRGYGLRDFTVEDPDGYEVRFASLVPS